MVRKTVELFECDICGCEAERYTIAFPDQGILALDRCEKHNKKLLNLREEKGAWTTGTGRSVFKVSSLEDIQKQRQDGNGK
jgi:hypothetical protein